MVALSTSATYTAAMDQVGDKSPHLLQVKFLGQLIKKEHRSANAADNHLLPTTERKAG